MFKKKPPPPKPEGRKGIYEFEAKWSENLFLMPKRTITRNVQVEVTELERRGSLSHLWYDWDRVWGVESAYGLPDIVPGWVDTKRVVWYDEE